MGLALSFLPDKILPLTGIVDRVDEAATSVRARGQVGSRAKPPRGIEVG